MRSGRFTPFVFFWLIVSLALYGIAFVYHGWLRDTHRDYVALLSLSLKNPHSGMSTPDDLEPFSGFWQISRPPMLERVHDEAWRAQLQPQGYLTKVDRFLTLPVPHSYLLFPDREATVVVLSHPRQMSTVAGLFAAWLLASGCFLSLVMLSDKSTLKALNHLTQITERFSEGDVTRRAELKSPAYLAGLSGALNQLADEMVRMKEEQKVVTHALNHEIRTPLARLRLALDMMHHCNGEQARTTLLRKMDRDIGEMETLAKEMLQWARLSHRQQPVKAAQVPLGQVVGNLVEELSELAPRVAVTAAIPPTFTCIGNERLLRQALVNTIGNAQKYANNTIQILLETTDQNINLYIDDDGPGIPVQDRTRIFVPFECLDESRSRQTGGVGLGMAIVYQIMLAHGGFAKADRAPLGGARIHLCWPLEAASEATHVDPEA